MTPMVGCPRRPLGRITMKRYTRPRSTASVVLWSLAVALLAASATQTPAVACNTPVFRYAMYNWPRSPFYVVYFHHGEIPEQDAATNRVVEQLAETEPAGPNIVFESVDVTDRQQMKAVPTFFEEARQELVEGTEPIHMIFPPWRGEPMVERLDEAAARKMVDSPVRKRIGELFEQGNATVLLILTGPDKEANAKAEKTAEEAVAAAASGMVPIAGDEPDFYETPPPEGSDDSAAEPRNRNSRWPC